MFLDCKVRVGSRRFRWLLSVLLLLSVSPVSKGAWLEWDRNSETNVAGYRVYAGVQSRAYNSVSDVGNLTLFEVASVEPGKTYYFAVTAYDTDGLESEYSDEVSWTAPVPNAAPVANADRYSTAYGTPLSITAAQGVLSNDLDPDGNLLSALLLIAPAHGALTLAPNGGFQYTPVSGFYGLDSFRYAAVDGKATSALCVVTIEVKPPPGGTPAPSAPAYVDVFPSSDGLWLEWDPSPEAVVTGYRVYWGLQSRTYASVGDAGSVLAMQFSNLLPNTKYYFAVTAYDADGRESGFSPEVAYTTPKKNRPPQAKPERYATSQQTTFSVSAAQGVLSNDLDPDGDELVAVLTSTTEQGTLTLSGNGAFTYVPGPNFRGTDKFAYFATDGITTSAVCVVTIDWEGEQDSETSVCSDCFSELDQFLASRPGEFATLVAARNTATNNDCLESSVAIYGALARAANSLKNEEINSILRSAYECIADDLARAADDREKSMKGIPASKWTQSARAKAEAIEPAIQSGLATPDLSARSRALTGALAALRRVNQLLSQAELAPATLSNRLFACTLTMGSSKTSATYSFGADHFVTLGPDGTPLSAGSYIFTRTGWNTGTLILLSESGDLMILELSFSRTRGRISGPHARGVFKVQ